MLDRLGATGGPEEIGVRDLAVTALAGGVAVQVAAVAVAIDRGVRRETGVRREIGALKAIDVPDNNVAAVVIAAVMMGPVVGAPIGRLSTSSSISNSCRIRSASMPWPSRLK